MIDSVDVKVEVVIDSKYFNLTNERYEVLTVRKNLCEWCSTINDEPLRIERLKFRLLEADLDLDFDDLWLVYSLEVSEFSVSKNSRN